MNWAFNNNQHIEALFNTVMMIIWLTKPINIFLVANALTKPSDCYPLYFCLETAILSSVIELWL